MNILLTNDDGFFAPGLQTLYRILAEKSGHEIFIVAPDSQKSATGHSITLFEPLFVAEHPLSNGKTGYAVKGTPADCVKLGVQGDLIPSPDMVISGINNGPNLGTDVFYSGTVSAAMEGNLLGLPALAVSLASFKGVNYEPAARCALNVVEIMLKNNENGLMNLNVPNIPEEEWQGLQITKLGKSEYENVFERRKDPLGRTYYWQGGQVLEQDEAGTDWAAIRSGFASLTPMHSFLTDHPKIEKWQTLI